MIIKLFFVNAKFSRNYLFEMLKFAKICKYSIIDNIFLFYNLVEHYVSSFLQKDII